MQEKTIGNWLARKAGTSITSTKLNRETDWPTCGISVYFVLWHESRLWKRDVHLLNRSASWGCSACSVPTEAEASCSSCFYLGIAFNYFCSRKITSTVRYYITLKGFYVPLWIAYVYTHKTFSSNNGLDPHWGKKNQTNEPNKTKTPQQNNVTWLAQKQSKTTIPWLILPHSAWSPPRKPLQFKSPTCQTAGWLPPAFIQTRACPEGWWMPAALDGDSSAGERWSHQGWAGQVFPFISAVAETPS